MEQRIVAQFTDQCGCSVTGTDEKNRLTFKRCPIHAAAPERLSALKAIAGMHMDDDTDHAQLSALCIATARTAIKAAKS